VTSLYTFSEKAEKFNLNSPLALTALDSAVAQGWDLLEVCGHCGELELCVVLSLSSLQDYNYFVDVEGLYVLVEESTVVDSKITLLFKYANYIVKEGRKVRFYIKKPYTLGVYYAVCGDGEISWSSYSYPSDESLAYLSEEND